MKKIIIILALILLNQNQVFALDEITLDLNNKTTQQDLSLFGSLIETAKQLPSKEYEGYEQVPGLFKDALTMKFEEGPVRLYEVSSTLRRSHIKC